MLCSYCKTPCAVNAISCPNCGAPLPAPKPPTWDRASQTELKAIKSNAFSLSKKTPPNFQKRKSDTASQSQQLDFADPGYSSNLEYGVPQLSFDSLPPLSSQAQPIQPVEATEPQSIDQRQALVPISYQDMTPAVGQTTMSLQLIPDQVIEHLLPAMPAMPETVHMPPIYTKPRPIIPKYQAISSFVSVIIVTLLLCGGSVYYAQTTGKLSFLHQITGDTRPPNLQTHQAPALPDPPNKVDMGPAYNIIPSAATAFRIDPKTNFAIAPVNVFSPGQPFYLSFSVISPDTDGRVYTKWYTNNQYFTTVQSKDLIKAHSNESGSVSITYPQAAEGSVELYWNDQLAQRLYFVVR